MYWVCGKAGSGKSTFMKHMYDERKTRQFLSVWAGNHRLCVATFFFWNSGTREQKSQRQKLATSLLHYLLSSTDCYTSKSSLPLPGVEMVRFLLDMNVDPNAACSSISAWERVLIYQANTPHESSCHSRTDVEYDKRTLQCRYIEIMRLLVLYKANPEARVINHEGVQLTAFEIVEDILVPRFPLEAAPLMQEVQEKLRQSGRSNQKKLHNEIEESHEKRPPPEETPEKIIGTIEPNATVRLALGDAKTTMTRIVYSTTRCVPP